MLPVLLQITRIKGTMRANNLSWWCQPYQGNHEQRPMIAIDTRHKVAGRDSINYSLICLI